MRSAYLDSNFVVYYFFSKEPSLKKRAQVIMAQLLTRGVALHVSPLTLDEAWYTVRKETGAVPINDWRVQQAIRALTQSILDIAVVIDTDADFECIWDAFANTTRYELKPRDAFHIAIMRHHDINCIVTGDKKFEKYEQVGGQVVWVRDDALT